MGSHMPTRPDLTETAMTEQANIPDVVAEVTDSFERYNQAIE